MAEKAKMIEQLKVYVDMYKKDKKFWNGEIEFCTSFDNGVHVFGVDNVFKIAKHLGISVEIKDRNSEAYKKEVSVLYEGVRFFALGTKEEAEGNNESK